MGRASNGVPVRIWELHGRCFFGIMHDMKAKAWRLYGAKDARLDDIELEPRAKREIRWLCIV